MREEAYQVLGAVLMSIPWAYMLSKAVSVAYFQEKRKHFIDTTQWMERREEYYFGKSSNKRQGSGEAGEAAAIDTVHLQGAHRGSD